MSKYRPATAHSDAIMRIKCPKCGTGMLLFGIEPERPGYELHSFECPKCLNIETRTGKTE